MFTVLFDILTVSIDSLKIAAALRNYYILLMLPNVNNYQDSLRMIQYFYIAHHRCPAYLRNLVTFTESDSTGSDHLLPGLLSQAGRGRSWEDAIFPSVDLCVK